MRWYNLGKYIDRRMAKMILKAMQETIDEYGYVTLADFYDLIDSRIAAYTDERKGWRSLIGARVSLVKRKGRYRIKLPALEEMDL